MNGMVKKYIYIYIEHEAIELFTYSYTATPKYFVSRTTDKYRIRVDWSFCT